MNVLRKTLDVFVNNFPMQKLTSKYNFLLDIPLLDNQMRLQKYIQQTFEAPQSLKSFHTFNYLILILLSSSQIPSQNQMKSNFLGMQQPVSYKSLTQNQIINQLKCIVAKQEQEINNLISQIEQLKNQKPIHKKKTFNSKNPHKSQNYEQLLQYSQHSPKKQNQKQKQNGIKKMIDQSLSKFQDIALSELRIKFLDFNSKILTPLQLKYLNKSQKKNQYEKQNSFIGFKSSSFSESLSNLIESLPNFLDRLTQITKQIEMQNRRQKQKVFFLEDRIKSQQQILKEMMIQYDKNIQKSELIEKKLMNQIERLKNNRQFISKFNQQIISKAQNWGNF